MGRVHPLGKRVSKPPGENEQKPREWRPDGDTETERKLLLRKRNPYCVRTSAFRGEGRVGSDQKREYRKGKLKSCGRGGFGTSDEWGTSR